MTQKERDELKRPERPIAFVHEPIRDFHKPIHYFDESAAAAYMDFLEAENQRMRELLIRAAKVLGGLGPGNLLAEIEHFQKTECEVPEVFIRLNDRSAEK